MNSLGLEMRMEGVGFDVEWWGNVVVWLMVGLGGCVVWVLLSVLLSRFKASSITHPGAGLT